MNTREIPFRVASIELAAEADRQGLLVKLIADIVNHETENGSLTAQQDNESLIFMPYWNTLEFYLKEAGFTELGHGHFSAAYSHKLLPGKVIKVGFKKEDSGAAYAAFCRMHQGRQGIPTIHDIQRHKGCYTVVLDRLRPLETSDFIWDEEQDAPEVEGQYELVKTIIEHGDSEALVCCDQREEDLAETCKEIRKFFEGIASFDMHRANAMVDDEGNVIITDPVSFTAKDVDARRTDFLIDPEDLLKEIAEVAMMRLIERCKERKAKRDPNGKWLKDRKRRWKSRKKHRKAMRKAAIEYAHLRLEMALERRNEQLAQRHMGTAMWKARWIAAKDQKEVREFEAAAAQRERNHDHRAIAMGGALAIDKILDDMLQG